MKIHLDVPAVCPDCGGTGLYRGFFEPKGAATPCTNCGGEGWITEIDIPVQTFTKKKDPPEHIEKVYPNNRIYNLEEEAVSIEDYQNGKIPTLLIKGQVLKALSDNKAGLKISELKDLLNVVNHSEFRDILYDLRDIKHLIKVCTTEEGNKFFLDLPE